MILLFAIFGSLLVVLIAFISVALTVRNLSGISLKDFFEKLEGPLGVMDCYFDSECQISGCNVKAPIERINDNIRKMLSTMTLKEVTQ